MEKDTITVKQFATLAFMVVIGDMTLIYPSIMASGAKQDAWISSILSQPLGMAIVYVFFKLYQAHPNLNFVEICLKVFGKWFGSALTFAYLFYFAIVSATCIREIGDFLTTKIYIQTPIRAIIIVMVCALTWALLKGIGNIGATSELLLPLVVVGMLVLFLSLLPQMNLSQIQPILNSGPIGFWKSVVSGAITPYGDILTLLMIVPNVSKNSYLRRDLFLASLAGGIMLTLLVFVSLTVAGPFITQHNIYISYFLSRKISIGDFFQRIEAVMASAWLISTYFKSLLYMHSFVAGTATLFRLQSHKPLVLPTCMLFFALPILLAPNILFYTITAASAWLCWDITMGFAIPIMVLLMHYIRSSRKGMQA